MKGTYFITGIDTNIGKSYATGWIAKMLNAKGIRTITQKMIQTGNTGYSEDIELHRKIMGIEHTAEDNRQLTYPIVFSYPASPHLAAEIDRKEIDLTQITQANAELQQIYDVVLLEGAGGLMVPITRKYLTIDYVAERNFPVVLVTSGRLGSINHTLLSLEALRSRGLQLAALIYNRYPKTDEIIDNDTYGYLEEYLHANFPEAEIHQLPELPF